MPLDYDPFSPDVRDDPYPHYARLRAEAPVHYAEASHVYCVSRYDDVRAVLRNATLFSSDSMRTMLIASNPGLDPSKDPELLSRMMAFAQSLPFGLEELMTARNLISEDPPRHGMLRAMVNRGFTPRRIAAWEPRMREIVADCMRRIRRDDGFDVIEDLAVPLPVRIIAEMLGVEPERIDDFKRWSDKLVATSTGSQRGADPVASGFTAVIREVALYVTEVAERRRREPGDDLVSVLVAKQDDGEAGLTTAEVAFLVQLLLVAGNETTTNLIGNATNNLLRHPEQLAKVVRDPARIPGLIEETLRYDGPVQFVFRRATADAEIAGRTIPANGQVCVLIGSANRDERQWGSTAETFDVMRDAQNHLAFGFGNHFCLGASLARLEARVALEALVPELPRLVRVEPNVVYVDSFLVRGPRHLALRPAA